MFKLQRLNVVKLTDSEQKRDALLQKGFQLVKDKKKLKKADGEGNGGEANEGNGETGETGRTEAAYGAANNG